MVRVLLLCLVLSGCGTATTVRDKIDLTKDAGLILLERTIEEAHRDLDKIEARHKERGRRIERLKELLGHE